MNIIKLYNRGVRIHRPILFSMLSQNCKKRTPVPK